ncbi:hypothetical protein [Rhodocyclus tenuis]|uniref:TnsA endonuclease N-terminal domain-containing protein n=1 Tax=Rhodocyclus tenuis TaxID=1066 RepID=A0A840G499_RHOTE|nr:hypothetical protein [Rhodocyclus tenuis]MBB4245840.1 hypothetical protein [Rhodocyclus tenuis]
MEKSDRKVITRSPSHGVAAVIAGGILNNYVEAESTLESDFIRRAALMPSHPKVFHQPFRLPISPKGYTPDFLLFFDSSGFKAVVETKMSMRIDAKYTELFDDAACFLRERGYIYFVVTEAELRHHGIHTRAKLLTRYAKQQVATSHADKIISIAASYPHGIPVGSLARKAQVPIHLILALVATGKLTTGPLLQTDASAIVNTLNDSKETADEILVRRWLGATPWDQDY